MIGRWWDRKGEYEIDMVAANELDKTAEIYEIKRNRHKIDLHLLEQKVEKMLPAVPQLHGFDIRLRGLDLQDM